MKRTKPTPDPVPPTPIPAEKLRSITAKVEATREIIQGLDTLRLKLDELHDACHRAFKSDTNYTPRDETFEQLKAKANKGGLDTPEFDRAVKDYFLVVEEYKLRRSKIRDHSDELKELLIPHAEDLMAYIEGVRSVIWERAFTALKQFCDDQEAKDTATTLSCVMKLNNRIDALIPRHHMTDHGWCSWIGVALEELSKPLPTY